MKIKHVIAVIILFIFIFVFPLIDLYGEFLWFSSLGIESVFFTVVITSIMLFLAGALAFLFFGFFNYKIARRANKKDHSGSRALVLIFLLIFTLLIGAISSGYWETYLRYTESTAFGVSDPVFGSDVGFYVFELPFYGFLVTYFLIFIIFSITLTLISYIRMEEIKSDDDEFPSGQRYRSDLSLLKKSGTQHISFLAGLLFFVLAFSLYLSRYSILFSSTGAVFGAGYTDINVMLPLVTILSIIAGVIGILFMSNIKIKKWTILRDGIGAFIIIAILGLVVSGVVQGIIVAPDEFNVEKPYIERNIQSTLKAYGLDRIEESNFPVSYNLTAEEVEEDATISNIRLWDWRPLQETYNQLQLFRTYYDFSGIDIDRYRFNGEFKEVMISPREMDIEDLQSSARTWVNDHLVYTHGYGVVMNPVDKVSKQGLPIFYVKDIPPVSDKIEIEKPQIYFGEKTNTYAVVRTTTQELDYPSGDENVYSSFEAEAGIPVSSLLNRVVFAVKFASLELLFSNSIKEGSKILIRRNILDRIDRIAPFLLFDPDPYIVVSEGKLFWIIDAYTFTDMYPYSEPFLKAGKTRANYMRNPIKVVVDAYTGDVSYYVIDQSDPVIQTYMKIFPALFRPFSEMPEGLRNHIRYPEGFFTVQSHVYSVYHMKEPNVFYNKEDVWVIPDEIQRGKRQQMIPYYIIMKLPGETSEEFILMIPFTPRGKENMIGWMAARSDEPNYGKFIVYRFSKQELTYGPMQIEARIDQDTEISQLFTLWGQSGSSLVRGNTLVIPIKDSIIYVEPIYLEATERGTLPELKRVIVAQGDRLIMADTLSDAFKELFGEAVSGEPVTKPGKELTSEQLLARIADLYDKAQGALKEGNLVKYAEYMNEIGTILKGR